MVDAGESDRQPSIIGDVLQRRDLSRLGLDPTRVSRVRLVHEDHGHRLFQVEYDDRSFVLKSFGSADQAVEVLSYSLLREHGVPTLAAYGQAEDSILIEDLAVSPAWRLAQESDIERAQVGVAVAEWYKRLHEVGSAILANHGSIDFLRREADELDASVIREIGAKLGRPCHPVLELAADHIEGLKTAMRSLPQTLNYNDFHWTNLALSRTWEPTLRAIVFDYHLLGIGLAYSDCRNVAGSLGSRARAAFHEAYGPMDTREALLDAPIATLYTLMEALARPRFPRWGERSLDAVTSGELERSLREALEIIA